MSNLVIGFIGVGIMLVLLFMGMSLSFSFALSGLIGIIMIVGFDKGMAYLLTMPVTKAASYTFIVMPLFTLLGNIAFDGGLTTDAYNSARKWFGHAPGGLAITTSVACGLFGAVCGSGSITALMFTKIAWPEMKENNYDPGLGLGAIAGSGPLAILIPPSIPLIMYGMLSGTSVAKLFMAGWVPGFLVIVALSACTIIQVLIHPEKAPRVPKSTFKEKVKSLKGIWAFLVLIIVMMGGIWGGVCTVNEAAGFGIICALIIVAVMRRMNFKQFMNCFKNTCAGGCSIFFMFVAIEIFNVFMTWSGLPKALATVVSNATLSPHVICWLIILVYLVLGCFLDSPPVMLLTTSILTPIVAQLGFDLVWFGIIVAFTVAIGALTPPVGINLFMVSSQAPEVPTKTIIKGTLPYLATLILVMILIYIFPSIATWLPNLMRG
ncbi:MAG: TRAP transporter large permease [Oscillospiraceae bacterium]|nr:TRAP transporter large permease [Oscillospiraceae bacterium]